jgi:hypothetical protein
MTWRILLVAVLMVILSLGVCWGQTTPGVSAGIVYTGSGNFPVSISWDVGLTAAPAPPVFAKSLVTLDGRYGGALTVPLDVPGDWIADRCGFKWSDSFEAVLQNTQAGPAALTDKFDWSHFRWGVCVSWTAYNFTSPF